MPLGLSQIISEPTRVEERSSTLIDHIYTNNLRNMKGSREYRCALSDHYLIMAIRKKGIAKITERSKVTYNDYSKFTDENVHCIYPCVNWQKIFTSGDANQIVDAFNIKFSSLISQLVK